MYAQNKRHRPIALKRRIYEEVTTPFIQTTHTSHSKQTETLLSTYLAIPLCILSNKPCYTLLQQPQSISIPRHQPPPLSPAPHLGFQPTHQLPHTHQHVMQTLLRGTTSGWLFWGGWAGWGWGGAKEVWGNIGRVLKEEEVEFEEGGGCVGIFEAEVVKDDMCWLAITTMCYYIVSWLIDNAYNWTYDILNIALIFICSGVQLKWSHCS